MNTADYIPTNAMLDDFIKSQNYDNYSIRLARLSEEHYESIIALGANQAIWSHARYPKGDEESFRKYFYKVIQRIDSINFVVIEPQTNELIGFTYDKNKLRSKKGLNDRVLNQYYLEFPRDQYLNRGNE